MEGEQDEKSGKGAYNSEQEGMHGGRERTKERRG